MINKIKTLIVILTALTMIAVPVAVSADSVQNELACGTNVGTTNGGAYSPNGGCASTVNSTGTTSSVGNLINEVIDVFSWLVGGISVIMIIYGGFRYVTSGGNDSSISGAKNTIIYALIGLVIVALAQVIVHFVLSKAFSVSNGASTGVIYSTAHLFR
jgi:hypothetical protein